MITCHCKQHYGPVLCLLIDVPLQVDTHTQGQGEPGKGEGCAWAPSTTGNHRPADGFQTTVAGDARFKHWHSEAIHQALSLLPEKGKPWGSHGVQLLSGSRALCWWIQTNQLAVLLAPEALEHVSWIVSEWSISGGRFHGLPKRTKAQALQALPPATIALKSSNKEPGLLQGAVRCCLWKPHWCTSSNASTPALIQKSLFSTFAHSISP